MSLDYHLVIANSEEMEAVLSYASRALHDKFDALSVMKRNNGQLISLKALDGLHITFHPGATYDAGLAIHNPTAIPGIIVTMSVSVSFDRPPQYLTLIRFVVSMLEQMQSDGVFYWQFEDALLMKVGSTWTINTSVDFWSEARRAALTVDYIESNIDSN